MSNQKPSLFRVISVDYLSLLSVLFPVVFWIYTAYCFYTADDSLQFFLLLAIGLTVVGIPLLFWRYRLIASVFDDGIETQGTITGVRFFRGRGRVDYTYSFQGQKFVGGNSVNRTKSTRALHDGQKVTILMDRNDPKRAFVKEIYL
jgi:hypothetical protein